MGFAHHAPPFASGRAVRADWRRRGLTPRPPCGVYARETHRVGRQRRFAYARSPRYSRGGPRRGLTPLVPRVDARAGELELRQRLGDERLAAEAGIDRHDQYEVEFLQHVVEPDERRRRIEHETGLAAAVVNEPDRAVNVIRRFGME